LFISEVDKIQLSKKRNEQVQINATILLVTNNSFWRASYIDWLAEQFRRHEFATIYRTTQ